MTTVAWVILCLVVAALGTVAVGRFAGSNSVDSDDLDDKQVDLLTRLATGELSDEQMRSFAEAMDARFPEFGIAARLAEKDREQA